MQLPDLTCQMMQRAVAP